MKIVIIEDNSRFASIICDMLEGLASSVVAVDSMDAAMEHIADKPDVVWLDLSLPDSTLENSIKRVAQIRAQDPEVAILVVSGYIDDITRRELEAMGADAVSEKAIIGSRHKLLSLVMLGLVNAQSRGVQRSTRLLERVADLIAKTFPQQHKPETT